MASNPKCINSVHKMPLKSALPERGFWVEENMTKKNIGAH